MFRLLNTIDNSLQSIEGLYQIKQLTASYLKAAWQTITAEKTQRILRAIGAALWVLGTIVFVGLLEVGKLAVREAVIVFQKQLVSRDVENIEPQGIQDDDVGTPPIQPGVIATQKTGVRELRQIATQRGIRNAGRMRKPELLTLLETTGGASAQG